MVRFPRHRRSIAAGLSALAVVAGLLSASALASPPDLPSISPDRLMASVIEALAADPSVEGHVDARVNLGLPDVVSGAITEQAGGLASFLGDHRLRVWRSPDGLRITDLLAMGERSLYVSRARMEAWAWDWDSFTAYHLGSFPHEGGAVPAGGWLPPIDPLALARLSLDALDGTTAVSVGSPSRVAGRAAYVLALEPKTPQTLVGRIEMSVDEESRLPLRVAVFPRGSSAAALSATFTSVALGPISPRVFTFTPPTGATVKRPAAPDNPAETGMPSRDPGGPEDAVRTFGRGWATVVAIRLPTSPGLLPESSDEGLDPLSLLPFSGSLFSARLTDPGDHAWLLYGAVPQSTLAAAEAHLP